MVRAVEQQTAAALIPAEAGLDELRGIAAGCRACDLWARGTQTVFGEGPKRARVMLVGEQPGDVEDETGHPFVGPAGHLLDRALEGAGIEREDVYLTNAVKHFKWEPRGKRRIHSKPNGTEIRACKPWLQREIELVEPEALVLLGATAAQALLGSGFKVTQHRGEFVESDLAPFVLATVHPSSILRAPGDDARHAAMAAFVADLSVRGRRSTKRGGGRRRLCDGKAFRVCVKAISCTMSVATESRGRKRVRLCLVRLERPSSSSSGSSSSSCSASES